MNNDFVVLVGVVVFAGIGYLIGAYKGRPVLGCALGALFTILGILIIAVVPKTIEKKAEEHAAIRSILGDK